MRGGGQRRGSSRIERAAQGIPSDRAGSAGISRRIERKKKGMPENAGIPFFNVLTSLPGFHEFQYNPFLVLQNLSKVNSLAEAFACANGGIRTDIIQVGKNLT